MDEKILVGCPVSDYHLYCTEEYLNTLKSLTYKNYDILLVDNSKEDTFFKDLIKRGINTARISFNENPRIRIVESRNILRQKVLEGDYDYFLSLEQDVLPPENFIESLLKHNKEVITGVYFADNIIPGKPLPELIPLVYVLENPETLSMRPLNQNELWEFPGLMEVISAGLGCVLIHKNVLKDIKFRYDLNTFDNAV